MYGESWFDYEETIEKMTKYFERNVSLLIWIKNKGNCERAFILKV